MCSTAVQNLTTVSPDRKEIVIPAANQNLRQPSTAKRMFDGCENGEETYKSAWRDIPNEWRTYKRSILASGGLTRLARVNLVIMETFIDKICRTQEQLPVRDIRKLDLLVSPLSQANRGFLAEQASLRGLARLAKHLVTGKELWVHERLVREQHELNESS